MTIVHELNGKKVITKDDMEIGEVSGAVMDEYWRITYLHVTLNEKAIIELGHIKLKEAVHKLGQVNHLNSKTTLCLPVGIIEENSTVLKLKKTIEEIKVLPECRIN